MIDPNRKYMISEIAKEDLLGVGYAGIYNLVRTGKLKAYNNSSGKSDNRYRIIGSDIIKFIEENKVVPIKKF